MSVQDPTPLTSVVHEPPESPAIPPPQRPEAPPDSPGRTLLGLIIVWASLFMVFMAHYMSERKIHLDRPSGAATETQLVRTLEPRMTLMLPLTMSAHETSPLQALANIAQHIGFTLDENALRKAGISEDPQVIRFDQKPLYIVIHQLLHNPGLGLGLLDRTLISFPQQLKTDSTAGSGRSLDWEARLGLSPQPLLIVPSGDFDLWFTVQTSAKPEEPSTILAEVWKGTERLATEKAALDKQGYALLSVRTAANMSLSVQEQPAADPAPPKLYRLQFHYQSFQ